MDQLNYSLNPLFFILLTYIILTTLLPYVYIFFLKRKFIERKFEKIQDYPDITILICAYNEENIIGKTLRAALDIDYPDYRIFIVDDCSTDRTFDMISEFKDQYPEKISIIRNNERIGKNSIMNRLIPDFRTEFTLILDANISVCPDILLNLSEKVYRKTGIVYGNLKFLKNRYSSITDKEISYWRNETFFKQSLSDYVNIISPVGGLYLLRNSLFKLIPKACQTEDMYILIEVLKKGYLSFFSEKAVAFEYTEKSSISEFMRKRRIMAGAYYIFFRQILKCSFLRLNTSDILSFFIFKVTRWSIPVIYFLLLLSCFYDNRNIYCVIFLTLNIFSVILILLEYLFNSVMNKLNNRKKIRVRYFSSLLYFYTLVTAGMCAVFYENKDTLWKKEKR